MNIKIGSANTAFIVLLLFVVAAVIELFAEFTHNRTLMFFSKPLLMPMLMLYYGISASGRWNSLHSTILVALFFAWVGGMSLMFTPETPEDTHLMGIPKQQKLFFAGVGAYFITHVLYIRVFLKAVTSKGWQLNVAWITPFVIYLAIVLGIVVPPVYAHPEKYPATAPVILYGLILLSMAVVALFRFGRTNTLSFRMVFAGACLFVLSDSLIALNFLALETPGSQAGFMIMLTYIPAEFLIVAGILQHADS